MPKNAAIDGGQPTGEPTNWDEATAGKCETISVLYARNEVGPLMQTAWEVTAAERQALEAGGHLYLTIYGERHPVVSLGVHNAAGTFIDPDQPAAIPAPPPRRAAVDRGVVMIEALSVALHEIGRQEDEGPKESRPTITGVSENGTISIEGVLDLKALVEAILDAAGTPRAGMVDLPIFTMSGIAAGADRGQPKLPGEREAAASPWPAAKSDDGTAAIWVITTDPNVFGGKHVARKWQLGRRDERNTPTGECLEADTLTALRAMLPPGLSRVERNRFDDPEIVETWI